MELFRGLIDAAPAGPADVPADVAAEQEDLRSGPFGYALGSLLVQDRGLAAMDRATSAVLPVTVINTTGAGGLVAMARRSTETLRIVAVDNAIRDTDDPVSNVARIASAARELDPEIVIRVQIPLHCHAYDQAVAEAEAEELQGLLPLADETGAVAEQLSTFVEADLAFAASIEEPAQLIGLLVALDALIDGAAITDAERLLSPDDHDRAAAAIKGWDAQRIGRIRRRLTAVRAADIPGLLDRLGHWKLISEAA